MIKMEIIEKNGKITIEWTFEGSNKFRKVRGKNGAYKAYQGVVVTIPEELVHLISDDELYTYIYEHFEKICLCKEEPPKEVTYHKARLNRIGKQNPYSAITEIPAKFFDTANMRYATYTYHPNQKDYVTGKKGLITLETHGYNPRKHLKEVVNPDEYKIIYETFIQETNTPLGIRLHENLAKILDTENLYIYYLNDEFHITSKEPTTEHIHTTEHELDDNLFKHGIIDYKTERIQFVLHLTEKDETNKIYPKITLKAIQAE